MVFLLLENFENEKQPLFPFQCWVVNKETTGTIFLMFLVSLYLGLNPRPPALETSTLPLGYRGGWSPNCYWSNHKVKFPLYLHNIVTLASLISNVRNSSHLNVHWPHSQRLHYKVNAFNSFWRKYTVMYIKFNVVEWKVFVFFANKTLKIVWTFQQWGIVL